ncbi:MAG: trimethylamine methyltransferase family protein [Anaerolineales bacterium]|nr:trimethylamine methyltransferase family protein [Chloroflexota bacterium]MBL7164433.1 trimethylamine methyltransferase family protein [Anaerolineales bacterium]
MTSPSFDHLSSRSSTRSNSLTREEITLLHEASLEIMARTGMRFFDQEALELFRKGGAQVTDGNLVCIPSHLVEWALRSAPKNITIFDQTGKRAMSLGGYRSYFGPGSDCMYIYDLDLGERRTSVLQDVINGVRLVDALPNLDFVMSMYLPSDVPDEIYERQQMAIMLGESTKPIVFVGIEAESTVSAVKMAEIVAGGADQLQRYPFVVNYVNTVSAFQHNEESVQRLLYAAERNLPTVYAPGNSRGMTAPMTAAGSLALGNAGQLAGLVLSQLKREGSPFLRSNPSGGIMDMASMVSLYGAPEGGSFGWDLTHHYGIPTFGIAGCSDAKIFDSQAAAEAVLTLFENKLNGVNLIHDIGYLDCAMTGSLELAHFCDEIIGWLKKYFSKLEISEDTLALDLIHEIGPDEHFLETEHTLRHVREDWQPSLIDRLDYHRWAEEGSTTLEERANNKVKEIIENHRAEPLPDDIIQRLNSEVSA